MQRVAHLTFFEQELRTGFLTVFILSQIRAAEKKALTKKNIALLFDVSNLSERLRSVLAVGKGNLYPRVRQLQRDGFITPIAIHRQANKQERNVICYQMTSKGEQLLLALLHDINRIINIMGRLGDL